MRVLLVGAGGYGAGYINTLRALSAEDPSIVLAGVVSTSAKKKGLDLGGVPIYDTIEEFYTEHTADLAIISTPPFLHCSQSIYALSHGSYVLCEKPIAPTLEEAEAMLAAEKKYQKWIAIGYQWSFSNAIQALKADILSGKFGKPISLKTTISWPRNIAYYGRGTGWGGRIQKDGVVVLDSIASNACAHFIHNMFFLLGDSLSSSADFSSLEGECFRANDIENFDTCVLKMTTEKGVKLYFSASHAAEKERAPEFVFTFENGKVLYSEEDSPCIKAILNSGETVCYGNPSEDNFKKVADCIRAVKEGTEPVCTVRTATPHTKLIKQIYECIPVENFPKARICLEPADNRIFVKGLFEQLQSAYKAETLLSEQDL